MREWSRPSRPASRRRRRSPRAELHGTGRRARARAPSATGTAHARETRYGQNETGPALGRKNWLFVEGDLGGERVATILTILGTCIAHGVNPRAYLHVVVKLLVNGFPNKRIRELLPDQIVKLHPELRLPDKAARPPSLSAPS